MYKRQVIITGDLTQKDLPGTTKSGLEQALEVLGKVDDIGFAYLTNKDVVRHPLVPVSYTHLKV